MQGFFHTKKPQNLHENENGSAISKRVGNRFGFRPVMETISWKIYSALSFFSVKMRFAMMPRIKAQATSVKVT